VTLASNELRRAPGIAIGLGILILAALAPLIFNTYWISFILTQVLLLGVAAASLIFLSAYGGMVSLAQVALYGTAGFVLGNVVTNGNTKGLNLGWHPWLGVVLGIAIATAIGLIFGTLANRSAGIYFLMITLTFAVIANLFFGQVTTFSGFGGISGIPTPGLIGEVDLHPNRLYYVALVVAVLVYAATKYLVRTPFGITLQGVRDDPVRMSSLGYNVPLHRTIAFGFAAFIASLGGVLFVWWNGHIDPASIDLSSTIDLLVICVIGGLYRLEGAWLGALVFVLINNYIRSVPGLSHIGLSEERFHTVIGVIFLVIILLSPGGLMGILGKARELAERLVPGRQVATAAGPVATSDVRAGDRGDRGDSETSTS
jgi:branched-chain amino acid transport system permease protein